MAAVNVVDNSFCSCGAPNEMINHFLLACLNYQEERRELLNLTAAQGPSVIILLYGSDKLREDENKAILIHATLSCGFPRGLPRECVVLLAR